MSHTVRRAAAAAQLALLCTLVSCRDLPTEPADVGSRAIRQLVGCRVEVATGQTLCQQLAPDGRPAGPASMNLIPDAQWMVEAQPGAYTPADSTYRMNLRLTNDTEATLGTPDGVQTTGIKVFLPVHPMGYTGRQPGDASDPYGMLIPPIQNTNTWVRARNHDGVSAFTAADQPFWEYPQMLAPWETSGWKEWQFTVDPSVSYFYFAVSIFALAQGEQAVPADAPMSWLVPEDSVATLFSGPNLIRRHPRMSGPYPRSVVAVVFTETASAEERQAAVNGVGGVVIGGNGAHYYVLVHEGADPVWSAVDALAPLPQVEAASPVMYNVATAYRRPNNQAGWQRADWQIHPDSARGQNWGPEAIAAPSAWGCETGSDSVKVAVIDLTPNHALAVSSVLHGPGDTGTGITGIMWKADALVTDASRGGTLPALDTVAGKIVSPVIDSMIVDLRTAITTRRVSVINLSQAIRYVDSAGNDRNPIVGDTADINAAKGFADFWWPILRKMENDAGHHPLYVIAAGNYSGADASYSGYPQLRSKPGFGSRVLVVAAHEQSHTGSTWAMWSGSSTGGDIAAPGDNLVVPGYSFPVPGTSLAAPHVAGIAGLLLSQDPKRTPQTVRSMILTGAARGGRTAGGHPIANAYESLKRGAEEPGAPLCGNRVWSQGAQIYAQRGTGDPEAIGPADAGLVGDVLMQHGGRGILYNSTVGGGKALLRQSDGTWAVGPIPADYNTQIGGSTWSVRQYAHTPADTIVWIYDATVNNNNWWRSPTATQVNVPVVREYAGGPGPQVLGYLPVPNLPEPEQRVCVEKTTGGFCTFYQLPGRYWLFRVAYPQAYQPLLITVTGLQTVFADSTPWIACTRDPSLLCRKARSDFQWTASRVYRMPLSGGTPQLVDSIPATILWMGQSEAPGSDELVMGSGHWTNVSWFDPDTRSQGPLESEVRDCVVEYRSLSAFATVSQKIDNPIACGWSSLTQAANHGNGGFSPDRAPAPPPADGGTGDPRREARIRIQDLLAAPAGRRR